MERLDNCLYGGLETNLSSHEACHSLSPWPCLFVMSQILQKEREDWLMREEEIMKRVDALKALIDEGEDEKRCK